MVLTFRQAERIDSASSEAPPTNNGQAEAMQTTNRPDDSLSQQYAVRKSDVGKQKLPHISSNRCKEEFY